MNLASLALILAVAIVSGCDKQRIEDTRRQQLQAGREQGIYEGRQAAASKAYREHYPLALEQEISEIVASGNFQRDSRILFAVVTFSIAAGFAAQYVSLMLIRRLTEAADLECLLANRALEPMDPRQVKGMTAAGDRRLRSERGFAPILVIVALVFIVGAISTCATRSEQERVGKSAYESGREAGFGIGLQDDNAKAHGRSQAAASALAKAKSIAEKGSDPRFYFSPLVFSLIGGAVGGLVLQVVALLCLQTFGSGAAGLCWAVPGGRRSVAFSAIRAGRGNHKQVRKLESTALRETEDLKARLHALAQSRAEAGVASRARTAEVATARSEALLSALGRADLQEGVCAFLKENLEAGVLFWTQPTILVVLTRGSRRYLGFRLDSAPAKTQSCADQSGKPCVLSFTEDAISCAGPGSSCSAIRTAGSEAANLFIYLET